MRKQRHGLELIIITVCIALLAGLFMARHKPAAPMSEEELAARSMSQYFKRGEYRRCLEVSADRLAQDAHDLVALRYQGACLAKQGHLQSGLKVLGSAIDMGKGPMDWLYSNRLGRLHLEKARVELQLHQAQAALTDLDKGLELIRLNDFAPWEFHYLRGLAQFALGDKETAKSDLSAAAGDAPSNEVVKHHLELKPSAFCEPWCPICSPWDDVKPSKGEGGLIKN